MTKFIAVTTPENAPPEIHLSYVIEYLDDVQTINCSVEEASYPIWLQLRKFTLQSRGDKSGYVPLFIEINNSKNMATALFIDKAYTEIMRAEKFRVLAHEMQ
jgi:hypothetical protein